MSPAEPVSLPPRIARRHWRRWAVIAFAIVAALGLLHVPLLRAVGGFLVADDPLAQADYVVILPSTAGDSAAIDQAIEAVRRGSATGLLFFQMPPTRSIRCGAWPDYESAIREYLKTKGISQRSVVFVPGPSRNSWEAARALGKWFGERPSSRCEVLCQEFRGRYERHIFATVLPVDVFNQLHFAAVPDRSDETNWWHDREGIQSVFQNYVRLAFVELNGETKASAGEWTLEQYEQSLPSARTAK